MKKHRKAEKRQTVSVAEVDREHCAGCFHLTYSGSEQHCDYIGNVGHCRPCPAGRDCTEYITAEEWKAGRKRFRAGFNEYIPQLHDTEEWQC